MCARRFLMCIFVLTLIVVAGASPSTNGAASAAQGGDAEGPFRAAPGRRRTGLHERRRTGWRGRGCPDDPALWLPDGLSPRDAVGKAAVFYIHPTTYLQTDRWNAPLDAGGDTEFRTSLFVQSQASAFNGAGQIWAPRYRQAASARSCSRARTPKRRSTSPIATSRRRSTSSSRKPATGRSSSPAHSQGALHLERLLREKVAGKPIAKRVVAAYVVGWPISIDRRPSGARPARLHRAATRPAASCRG